MIAKNFGLIIVVAIALTCLSCEKEKIEYAKQYTGSNFDGFTRGESFIVHDESITYNKSFDTNWMFPNLFEYQNGRKLGKSIHSLDFFEFEGEAYGIITVEGENMIEIIDKNFVSVIQIPLISPRDIKVIDDYIYDTRILVSYGDNENGGIALLKPESAVPGTSGIRVEIYDTINTGNNAGFMYIHNNYIYVSSTGSNMNDSTIAKIYYHGGSLQKADDLAFGKRPIILFDYIRIQMYDYYPSLIIQCLGDNNEASKIVHYNLIESKITKSFNISNENIPVEILGLNSNMEFFYKSNNKLYQGTLESPESTKLLTEINITKLITGKYVYYQNLPEDYRQSFYGNVYYSGFYSGENEDYSVLYLFESSDANNGIFEVIDSIKINKGAKNIVTSPYYY